MPLNFSDIPVLQRSNVKMRDPDSVLKKLNLIVRDKKERLQIITDYDSTLTKQHVNGVHTHSSFGLLALWDALPQDFITKDLALKGKYYPIEADVNMTPEEKIPYMVQWYAESEKLWTGIPYNLEELQKLVSEKGPELRDGTYEFCKYLEKHHIPILVLSAGLGNVLTEVLRCNGIVENDFFHIISNFFKIQNGVVKGYGCRENGFFIHPFNKNGVGASFYFKKISSNKPNVILMGDSLGDAKMDQGVPNVKTVIKIGFLYGTQELVDRNLPKYLENFDVVLIDDQTMEVLQRIVELVVKS